MSSSKLVVFLNISLQRFKDIAFSSLPTTSGYTPSQVGVTLIECLIAMVITVVGVLAVAMLIVKGIEMQKVAQDSTTAVNLAKAKVEELRIISPTAVNSPRASGGNLNSNSADHFDVPSSRFVRRWTVMNGEAVVADDVPVGTQKITVAVKANEVGVRLPDVSIEVLMQ